MLNKLKQLFPSAVDAKELTETEKCGYTVFISPNHSYSIAIKTNELSERDKQLLSISLELTFHHEEFQSGNPAWFHYFTDGGVPPAFLHSYVSFRFFYLEGRKLYENRLDLLETLRYYFDEQVKTVFMEKNFLVVLVPDHKQMDTGLFDAGELAGVLAADLLLDVFIYAGRRIHEDEDIFQVYRQEKQLIQLARAIFPKERTFQEYELLPFVLPLLSLEEQTHLYHYALAGLEKETELVDTLYHFFLCHLNSSHTAKELHMHRNTLQYRLDKILERTGIDMKQFQNACALYVLIRKLGT